MNLTKKLFNFSIVSMLLGGIIFMIGCESTKKVEGNGLVNDVSPIYGDWILSSILTDGSEILLSTEFHITFSAEYKGDNIFFVYGNAGVNEFNGELTVNGNNIILGNIETTMKAGAPDAENIERIFFDVLNKVNNFVISEDGKAMSFSDVDGKNVLIFNRLGLENTSWVLDSYNTGNAILNIDDIENKPEISFDGNEGVSGFTGINYINGTYIVNLALRSIQFPQIGATRMASPSEAETMLELTYLDLLNKAAIYQISGSNLKLLSADGSILLVFNRK